MTTSPHQHKGYDEWCTPPHIVEAVKAAFKGLSFLDPATSYENPVGASLFFTKKEDGLVQSWAGTGVCYAYVNPPYGKDLKHWIAKIGQEASNNLPILALLPANRFETQYVQEWLLSHGALDSITFIRKRVSFVGSDGSKKGANPFGSVIYAFNTYEYNVNMAPIRALGKTIEVKHE